MPENPGEEQAYADALADLDRAVGRLADRLRSLSLTRLDQPLADGGSRAREAYALAGWLAVAGDAPPGRTPPWLGPAAVADQVAVTGRDLVAALRGAGAGPAARPLLAEARARVRRCREVIG